MSPMFPQESVPPATRKFTIPVEGFELAPNYETDRLVLLVREPAWVYAYWDIRSETRNSVLAAIPKEKDPKPVLRIYRLIGSHPDAYFDIEITPFADSWYVHVGKEYVQLAASVGYKTSDGQFHPIIRSAPIEKYGEANQEQDEVMTLIDLYPGRIENNSTSPQMWLQAATEARCQWVKAATANDLITRGQDVELKTEIILHGQTDPKAAITVNGVQIPTDENGRFSIRYPLEHATLVIPIQATWPSENRQITITPVITQNIYKTESPGSWSHRQGV